MYWNGLQNFSLAFKKKFFNVYLCRYVSNNWTVCSDNTNSWNPWIWKTISRSSHWTQTDWILNRLRKHKNTGPIVSRPYTEPAIIVRSILHTAWYTNKFQFLQNLDYDKIGIEKYKLLDWTKLCSLKLLWLTKHQRWGLSLNF